MRIEIPIVLMLSGMLIATAIASWRPFTLEERVQRSDAIAIVTVTNINRVTNGIYRSVAVAHVEQSLKGVKASDSIQLLFDSEPVVYGRNPHYAKGEHCLLFLSEVSPGKYILIQSVFDKHLIKNGEIEDTDGEHGIQIVALTNVIKQVSVLLSEKKESSQSNSPAMERGSRLPEVFITAQNVFTFYREFSRLTKEPHLVAPLTATLCTFPTPELVEREKHKTGPHYLARVHLYANVKASKIITERGDHFSTGAIIIKEKLAKNDSVEAVGGMIKRAKGYDLSNGDWEYFYAAKTGGFSSGKLANCIECHKHAETDFTFSLMSFPK
jgi:hypothetical protein